jgi:acetoin utilization protein AcuB
MRSQQLISAAIPALHLEDTANQALALMDKNNVTQLPVISDDGYVCLVLENDLLDLSNPDVPLSESDLLTFKPAIFGSGHPFEALRIANELNLSVVPVVDHEQKYLGSITKDGLLKYITETSGINVPGGVIVLEIAPRNYTLVEIARICENEDVIILNTQVHATELGMLEVTLKLNRSSVEATVSSFERYNYHVKESFGIDGNKDDIAGNYDLLMNYINM